MGGETIGWLGVHGAETTRLKKKCRQFREMQTVLDLSLSSCLQVVSFFVSSLVSSFLIFSSVFFISLTTLFSSLLFSCSLVMKGTQRWVPAELNRLQYKLHHPVGGPFSLLNLPLTLFQYRRHEKIIQDMKR